jgi:uncharacterized MAPEG superfamily protein
LRKQTLIVSSLLCFMSRPHKAGGPVIYLQSSVTARLPKRKPSNPGHSRFTKQGLAMHRTIRAVALFEVFKGFVLLALNLIVVGIMVRALLTRTVTPEP